MATGRSGPRILDALGRSVSGAILFREAARTSRRWQTYGSRMLFSGVLVAVMLIGLRFALGASRTAGLDAAELSGIGDTLFGIFCVVQLGMAMVLAPLSTAAAIVEERTDRTFDLLVLTRLRASQIFGGKVLSRILVLLTVVLGAMPVLALVVNFGGVSTTEIVVLTVHTLVNVVVMGMLGAFFGLFTRSPLLAMMASIAYALPFFVLVPFGYAAVSGEPATATHLSTLSAFLATDLWGLLPVLGFVPALVLMVRLASPLFELQVSGADFEACLSDDIWRVSRGVLGFVTWGVVAIFTLPFSGSWAWEVQRSGLVDWTSPVDAAVHGGALAWNFAMFAALIALGTWGFLRVAIDVVDGIDGIFTKPVSADRFGRSSTLGTHPVWWREARLRAVGSSAAPILVTWGLVLLAIFQTGTWLAPGVLLGIGVGNTVAVLVLTAWLASRSIAEERRRGTLEVLLVTTIRTREIVTGKAAGAALPSAPLMLVGLPMIAFGYTYLNAVERYAMGTVSVSWTALVDGAAMWLWTVPVWACANVAAMAAAARLPNPRSAFGLTMAGLAGVVGWTPVVGRMFPDLPVLAPLARLIAPPLAGGASPELYVASMILWSAAALVGFVALSRRLRAWIGGAVAVLLALGLLAPRAARAQPSPEEIAALETAFGIRLVAVPVADGLSRDGRWTSVRVAIENRGTAVNGALTWTEPTVDGERRVVRPVSLPEGGVKTVDVPVLRGPSPLARGLWFEGGARRAAAVVEFVPVAPSDVAIGVIGRDPLGLPAAVIATWSGPVPGRRYTDKLIDDYESSRAVRTGVMPVGTLPAFAAGYDALDWIVWPDADPTRLSADQLRALLDWVADGGHLLVTVTERWRAVAGSPLGDALPVTLHGVSQTDLTPLASILAPSPSVSGVGPAAEGDLRADRTTFGRAWSNEGRPLWAIGTFGVGTIHVLLANPAVQPISALDRRAMWRTLLHLPEPGAAGQQLGPDASRWHELELALHLAEEDRQSFTLDEYDGSRRFRAEEPLRTWLSDIPNLAPLPIEWLAAFGALYLFWIGPVDYLVLRALGRQTWTWVTFPVVIVVFSTLALVGAAQQKGSQSMLRRVERVDVLPDAGRHRGDTWLGLFSTRKATLTVGSAQRAAVVQPLLESGFMKEPRSLSAGGPTDLVYDAETWSFGYSRSRWMADTDARLDAEWVGDELVLTNELDVDLIAVALVRPTGERAFAGPLGRGETRAFSVEPGEVDEQLAWALDRAFDQAADRGMLQTNDRWWVAGLAAASVDPIRIDGLSPQVMHLTVFRQRLPDREPAVARRVFTATIAPDDAAHWARLVCDDQGSAVRVRGGQARIPLPSGVTADTDGCRLEIAPPLSGWYSGVEVSIDRPNQCRVTARDVTCEPAP